ncbi:hypothetical protein PUN28_006915 [Cardiocondyla obscurior]|uniref:Uncharacterized protein n=1 Tax=Cardiocondyla obscurior TaxID=286306 RepID=A0AAW2G0E8_9HYME
MEKHKPLTFVLSEKRGSRDQNPKKLVADIIKETSCSQFVSDQCEEGSPIILRGGGGLGKAPCIDGATQGLTQPKVPLSPILDIMEEQARDGHPASAEQLLITGSIFNSADAHADR